MQTTNTTFPTWTLPRRTRYAPTIGRDKKKAQKGYLPGWCRLMGMACLLARPRMQVERWHFAAAGHCSSLSYSIQKMLNQGREQSCRQARIPRSTCNYSSCCAATRHLQYNLLPATGRTAPITPCSIRSCGSQTARGLINQIKSIKPSQTTPHQTKKPPCPALPCQNSGGLALFACPGSPRTSHSQGMGRHLSAIAKSSSQAWLKVGGLWRL